MRVRALPLAQALTKRGHQVALYLPPFHTRAAGGTVWQDNGVEVHNVAVSGLPLLGHAITGLRLARAALAWQPEVVHCFKPKAYSGIAQWLLWWRRKLGRPFRLVLDTDDWEGWGGWNELESYPWWQKSFFARQERWGLTHTDAITVASRALETIIWSCGIDPRQVYYVPNGASVIPDHSGDDSRDPTTLLLYTRFFEFDVQRAVAVLQLVRRRIPAARLVTVGKGLFGEEDRFLAEAQAAGLGSAVDYVGWVEEGALPGYLSAAGCAIYPFDDTLINRTKCAIKLVDLLAAGVPVVAEAVGQNKEYIEHGRSGLLVPPGNEAAFAAEIVRVLEDRQLRDRLSAGAQKRVATEFMWDRLAGQVERAYTTA